MFDKNALSALYHPNSLILQSYPAVNTIICAGAEKKLREE